MLLLSITKRRCHMWWVTPRILCVVQTLNIYHGLEANTCVPPPLSCQQLPSSKPSQCLQGWMLLDIRNTPCAGAVRAAWASQAMQDVAQSSGPPQAPAPMAFGCKPQRDSPRTDAEITFWLRPRAVHHIIPTADWKRPTHGDSFLMAEAFEKTHKHFWVLQKIF